MKPPRVSHGLPRSHRLPGPAGFKNVFDNCQRRSSHQNLLILAHHRNDDCGHRPRLGMVVSKKSVRLSTQRNRIKRAIREFFRLRPDVLEKDTDYIVLTRHGIDLRSNAEIHSLLQSRLRHLSQKTGAKSS